MDTRSIHIAGIPLLLDLRRLSTLLYGDNERQHVTKTRATVQSDGFPPPVQTIERSGKITKRYWSLLQVLDWSAKATVHPAPENLHAQSIAREIVSKL